MTAGLQFRFSCMLAASNLTLLAACSGGGTASSSLPPTPPPAPVRAPPAAPPPPPPPPPIPPNFSALKAPIDAFPVANMIVLVGDASGILYQYEKGDFDLTRPTDVASASKLVTGLGLWQLVENGTFAEADNPQDYISFWTDVSGDGRSAVSLGQLLSFTSGFNSLPTERTCIGDGQSTLEACVRLIYDDGISSMPGSQFYYGPDHMQIAALMAEGATREAFTTTLRINLFIPLGISAATKFPDEDGSNPRFAGALISTPEDYGKLLTAVLAGKVVNDRAAYLRDRIAGLPVGFRPEAIDLNGVDWHYGFGFWKECDDNVYSSTCDAAQVISSPGAQGFTPWIDFTTGYWGIIAMEERRRAGFEPSSQSVRLEQTLQSLIEAELAP